MMYLHGPYLNQEDWGHPDPYPAGTWVPYAPVMYVIHYGGGGPYNVVTKARAFLVIVGWRRYHMESRGWRDIAYNAFAWKKLILLRGLNQNGAHQDSYIWGKNTFTVVFPVGPGEQPRRSWLRAFARQWIAKPMPVTVHGRLPEQYTSCAGAILNGLVDDEFWLGQYRFRRTAVRSVRWHKRAAVAALAHRLNALGYEVSPSKAWINKRFEGVIKEWQADVGLPVTGIVGVEDLRELGR